MEVMTAPPSTELRDRAAARYEAELIGSSYDDGLHDWDILQHLEPAQRDWLLRRFTVKVCTALELQGELTAAHMAVVAQLIEADYKAGR